MENFNIEIDTKKLKELVSIYEPSVFLGEITAILKYDGYGRIPFLPFIALDSPLRQLSYIAALNLSSDVERIKTTKAPTNDEWTDIMEYAVRIKAGYYDALLPKPEEDDQEYDRLYRIAAPVFFDYFDTGVINYEEQEIAKILDLFKPFDALIQAHFGLTTNDFIKIYESLDERLESLLNEPLRLIRENPEVKAFKDEMLKSETPPSEWHYKGGSPEVKRFIDLMSNHLHQNRLKAEKDEKTQKFISIFSISREASDFRFYTENNPILVRPIFRLGNEHILLLAPKQLLHAIHKTLLSFIISTPKSEKFFIHRGKWLQHKCMSLFKKFLKGEGHYYNEFKVDGEGQDILVLFGSLAFIIEAKAGKEAVLSSRPNIRYLYTQYVKTFKQNIDEGYDQAFRIKEKFIDREPFDICDKNNKLTYRVRAKNYRNAFSIIITLDRFRGPQINLPSLLDPYQDDVFPLSLSIDDLEVIILTMLKLQISPGHFERLLIKREKLQGRTNSNDEMEIWGHLLFNREFKVPEDPTLTFHPGSAAATQFDELYKTGLGFENERKLDKKKSKEWKVVFGTFRP